MASFLSNIFRTCRNYFFIIINSSRKSGFSRLLFVKYPKTGSLLLKIQSYASSSFQYVWNLGGGGVRIGRMGLQPSGTGEEGKHDVHLVESMMSLILLSNPAKQVLPLSFKLGKLRLRDIQPFCSK